MASFVPFALEALVAQQVLPPKKRVLLDTACPQFATWFPKTASTLQECMLFPTAPEATSSEFLLTYVKEQNRSIK